MKSPELPNLHTSENENRKLAYVSEFKDWIKEHPGALSTARKLIEMVETQAPTEELNEWWNFYPDKGFTHKFFNKAFTEDEISVFLTHWSQEGSHGYRVIVGEDEFFVKREQGKRELFGKMGGYEEGLDTIRAKELLAAQSGVDVVDFMLAYEDKQKDIRYFVAPWVNMPLLIDFLSKKELSSDVKNELAARFKRAAEILETPDEKGLGYFEVLDTNAFYDQENDKIILFDLNRKQK